MARAMRDLGGVHLITDRALVGPERLLGVIADAAANGVTAIHLRERDLAAADLYELARTARHAIAGRALLLVNARLDVALAAGADGVQLGERSLRIRAALAVVGARARGRRFVIGRSVHSAEGAATAEAEGADFVVLGTIFASRSHPG